MQNLITVMDWIRYATSELTRQAVYFGHGTDNALDEAVALVLGVLKLPFTLDSVYFQARLTEKETNMLQDALKQRIDERIPTPYITQRTLYGGYEFYIDNRALIPRSPIAELIEGGMTPYWQGDEVNSILDLCCGSGCIGILAKYYFPEAHVVLADIDSDALAVAYINRKRAGMDDEDVVIVKSDGFLNIHEKFDWILCNPPYISVAEMGLLIPEYQHEPRQALVSGKDGLDLAQIILAQAADYLTDEGLLVMEVGMNYLNWESAYPEIGFDWVTFARGGEGVFVVSKDELLAFRVAQLI